VADADYGSVVLLLPFDTDWTDYSRTPKTLTASGNAAVSTTQKQYGAASAYFDGTGDYLTVTSHVDLAFSTGDFTVEFWAYQSSAKTSTIYEARPASTNGAYVTLGVSVAGALAFTTGGSARITSADGEMPTTTWTHIALSRSGTSTKLFVGGTQVGSTYTDSTTYLQTAHTVARNAYDTNLYFNGYVDDVRVTKGVARYTTTFTPPAAFIKTISGTVKDDTNSNAVRTIRAYMRGWGGIMRETQSASDGTFSLRAPDTEHVVICLDDDAGAAYNAQIFDRVLPG